MYQKAKKAFIPAAIACIGVEHAPGALPCQAGVSANKVCNPYDIKFINAKPETAKPKAEKNSNLYSRASNKEINKETSKTTTKETSKTETKNIATTATKSIDVKSVQTKSSKEAEAKSVSSIAQNEPQTKKVEQAEEKSQQISIKEVKIEPTKTQKSEVAHSKTQNKPQSVQKIVTKAKDIKIPELKPKKVEPKKTQVAKTTQKSKDNYTYVIDKGDTLAKLALKFNTSVSTLLSMNNLKEDDSIKVGQKILIPKNNLKVAKKKSYKGIYEVEKGDTLAKISKLTGISVAKLIKYNNLENHTIKVGQKIYLRANNIEKKNTIAKKPKNIKKIKTTRQLRVTATAYTSHVGQTDKTPFLAAWNNRIRPGMKIIAVSRDLIKKYGLTNGVRVRLKGLPGYYVVRDKMNKRFRNKIDIYMGTNKRKALKWGKRKIVLMW
jgi:LysM repeat protein